MERTLRFWHRANHRAILYCFRHLASPRSGTSIDTPMASDRAASRRSIGRKRWTLHVIRRNTSAAGALAIAGTILVAGCSPHELTEARIQTTATAPMAVSCEPTQRAIVRPVVINGVTMSQVECTTTGVVAGPAQAVYQPGVASAVPVSYSPIPSSALDDARLVRAASTRVAAGPVTYVRTPERVAYRPSDRWPKAR